MSGHSKWATTKHKKAAIDAKRSALFSKLSRNITVAAKLGGDPLPENNASLAAAVARARAPARGERRRCRQGGRAAQDLAPREGAALLDHVVVHVSSLVWCLPMRPVAQKGAHVVPVGVRPGRGRGRSQTNNTFALQTFI